MAAKSTAQKKKENHPRKDRMKEQPILAPADFTKPKTLGKFGSIMWDKIVPQLQDLGISSDLDYFSLEGLCHWYDVYKRLNEAYELEPDLSSMTANRLLGNIQRSWNEYRRLATQFGLTAISRNNISMTPASDELADFLKDNLG